MLLIDLIGKGWAQRQGKDYIYIGHGLCFLLVPIVAIRVDALAKDSRPHPNDRGTFGYGDLQVTTHTHREFLRLHSREI